MGAAMGHPGTGRAVAEAGVWHYEEDAHRDGVGVGMSVGVGMGMGVGVGMGMGWHGMGCVFG